MPAPRDHISVRPSTVTQLHRKARPDPLIAEGAAIEVAWALTSADDLPVPDATTEHLPSAPTRRSIIDQAIGIVMCENECDAVRAAGALSVAAQRQGLDVFEVAGAIITIARGAPVVLEPRGFSD